MKNLKKRIKMGEAVMGCRFTFAVEGSCNMAAKLQSIKASKTN